VKELDWGWQLIAQTLLWKLAPGGVVLFPHELKLPQDRVLLEERLPDRINLSFITLKEAHARTHAERSEQRATTDKLVGRWKQIAVVMAWKLAKNGVTLTEYDRQSIPSDVILMTAGHRLGVEWQFVPRVLAEKQRLREFEDTGKDIRERPN
jgi:hypothetical protein